MKCINRLIKDSNGNTKLLYYLDYYDGPLSGIMLWNNEKAYFYCTADDELREFEVYRINPDDLEAIEKQHELFRKYVGTHTDYNEPNSKVHPKETHHLFYDNYKAIDIRKEELLGKFYW